MLHTPDVAGNYPTHMHVLQVLSKPVLDLAEVEKCIKSDPAMCYRLLRYLNSPFFYLKAEVRSVLHALALLGEAKVRKWLLLACAVETASREPELVNAALIRARFAELLGPAAKLSSSALFLLGLLSLMDAIMEVPMELILEKVALPGDVRGALLGNANPLRQCHELVLAYEAGDWAACEERRKKLHVPEASLQAAYLGAVKWTRELFAV
jgi:EAL and modified HD-GYP domain-containing signal transduction protein